MIEFQILKCPYCGANLDIFDGRKYIKCDSCGCTLHISGDTVEKDNPERRDQYDPDYESLSYAIEMGKVRKALAAAISISKNDPMSPHIWMARGFALLKGKDLNENYEEPSDDNNKEPSDETSVKSISQPKYLKSFKKAFMDALDIGAKEDDDQSKVYVKVKNDDKIAAAGSAWKRAMKYLNSDAFLSDYADLISYSLLNSEYLESIHYKEVERTIKILSEVSAIAENKFNVTYFTELCYSVFIRYSGSLNDNNSFEWNKALSFLASSIAYDPDCRSASRKLKMLNRYSSKGNKDFGIYNALSIQLDKRISSMKDEDVLAIASYWNTSKMENSLSFLWYAMINSDCSYSSKSNGSKKGNLWGGTTSDFSDFSRSMDDFEKSMMEMQAEMDRINAEIDSMNKSFDHYSQKPSSIKRENKNSSISQSSEEAIADYLDHYLLIKKRFHRKYLSATPLKRSVERSYLDQIPFRVRDVARPLAPRLCGRLQDWLGTLRDRVRESGVNLFERVHVKSHLKMPV